MRMKWRWKNQPNLEYFVKNSMKNEKDFQKDLSSMIIEYNLPFNLVENPFFKNL